MASGTVKETEVDALAWAAVFGETAGRARHRAMEHPSACRRHSVPASGRHRFTICTLAMGRGEVDGFTVPAINVRMIAYTTLLPALVIRSAKKLNSRRRLHLP